MARRSDRRGGKGLLVLVVVVLLLLLAEGALVAAVFVSPRTAERLEGVAASAERIWSGTDAEPGLRERISRTARRAYEDWIAPLWEGPRTPAPQPDFTACVDCHRDYAKRRRFSVYMDHPLHAELGLACVDCHPETPHPSPPHPQESVCADCHPEVREPNACGTCHPPGSLPHFYLLGAPRDAAVRCDVCHPKGVFEARGATPLVPPTDLTGADRGTCRACHQEETCARCHAEPHPPDWVGTHGTSVGQESPAQCLTCHTGTWCADRCHAVSPTRPFVPRPLPSPGVRP